MKLLKWMITTTLYLNFETLKSFFDLLLCLDCGKNKLNNNLEMSMSFSYQLNSACEACSWSYGRYISKYVENEVIKGLPRQM